MTMKLLTSRASRAVAAAALATISLAACGSDPPTSATGSSSEGGSTGSASGLACPAGRLSVEGSSAQNDAITETIASYGAECGDKATIEAYSLSRTGYVFYDDLQKLLNNDGGMFNQPPANSRTNLSNGALGFFQASAINSASIVVEE